MQLCTVLFNELHARGVRHVFGIPGDFALNLYEALERDGRFTLVRFSHEPSVGFAADGCARITGGLGVCLITYGAGGLNMVNPVACAYAEESPLVVLSGGPGLAERRAGIHVHHEVKSFESQFKVYQEVTDYCAILDDPRTAASHIRHALDVATTVKRPVYLEIPRDMVSAEVLPPQPSEVAEQTDTGAIDEAVAEIVARLRAAARPVLIVGVEVHRFQLREPVIRLAERLGVPVASSFLGRGVFPTRHPQFVGTYLGLASPPELRSVVESSDCVLLLGESISETSLGVSAHLLSESQLIIAVARDVFIGHHRYQHTSLASIIARLVDAASVASPTRAPFIPMGEPAAPPGPSPEDDKPITMARVIDVLNEFVAGHPDMPLVSDTGDCLFASVDIRSNECVAPAYYATMGFAVPAALGIQVSSGRRPLVLVGDGAFQMTGPEIAHAPAFQCNPIVVLLNNNRWEMLQAFFPNARYNDTAAWPFAKLAALWGGRGFEVGTPRQLRSALAAAWLEPRHTLIEVSIAKGDISTVLRRFVDALRARTTAATPDPRTAPRPR
jgi:indolepyruvate decarboxylase